MASADVFLAFGADTGALEAGLAAAQAAVRGTVELHALAVPKPFRDSRRGSRRHAGRSSERGRF